MGLLDKKNRRILGLIILMVIITYRIFGDDPVVESEAESAAAQFDTESVLEEKEAGLVQGLFVIGHEVRSFRECGAPEEDAMWFVDESGLVDQLYQAARPGVESYEEVFASVWMRSEAAPTDGFGADFAGLGVIEGINYWPIEGFGCDYDWQSFKFTAFGNEPFWRFTLNGDHVTITRPESEALYTVDPNGWPLQSDNGDLTVHAEENECRDTMSGTYFSREVTVELGEKILHGCGMIGVQ